MSTGTVNSLHYEERGEGPPVLFLHGTGAHSVIFEPSIDRLPAGRRLIAYDRRGYGRSQGRLAKNLKEQVADAAALLRHLDATPATVVTLSGGAVVALHLAIDHPGLVSALVMAEPAYAIGLHPSLSTSRTMGQALTRWLVRRDPQAAALGFYRWATRYTTGGNAFDGYPEEWRATATERTHARAALRELLQLGAPLPLPKAVRQIDCPVTLLIGDIGEPVFHRTTRRVQRLLPSARLVSVARAGHLIPTDQPQAFADAVAEATGLSAAA